MMGAQFLQRILGIVSMLFLARILTPNDFGIVSIATVVVFFVDSLSHLGAKQYVAQAQECDDDVVNTAWTLNFIFKAVAWLIFVLSVNWLTDFLDKREISNALYAISFILLLSSFINPGLWVLGRELDYRPQFILSTVSKFISVPVVLVLAYITESYWSMVTGTLLGYLITAVCSYFVCNYKPKLSLVNTRQQFAFSKWMLLRGWFGYARAEADSLVIAKFFNLDMVGVYGLFKNLAMMPLTIIVTPLTEPLLSSFSKSNRESGVLAYQLNTSLLVALMVVCPIAGMMVSFHQDMVLLLLGEKWQQHSLIFALLAPVIISLTLMSVISQLVLSKGKVKSLFYFDITTFFITTTVLMLVGQGEFSAADFALIRTVLSVLTLILFLILLAKNNIKMSVIDALTVLSPFVAVCIVTWFCYNLNIGMVSNVFFRLTIECLFFLFFYTFLLLLAYFVFKERQEMKIVFSLFKNLTSKFYKQ